jgi:hypothetical protein
MGADDLSQMTAPMTGQGWLSLVLAMDNCHPQGRGWEMSTGYLSQMTAPVTEQGWLSLILVTDDCTYDWSRMTVTGTCPGWLHLWMIKDDRHWYWSRPTPITGHGWLSLYWSRMTAPLTRSRMTVTCTGHGWLNLWLGQGWLSLVLLTDECHP